MVKKLIDKTKTILWRQEILKDLKYLILCDKKKNYLRFITFFLTYLRFFKQISYSLDFKSHASEIKRKIAFEM